MIDFTQFISGVVVTIAFYGIIFTLLYLNEKLELISTLRNKVLFKSLTTRLLIFIGLPLVVLIIGLLAYYGVPTSDYDYIARFKDAGRIDNGSKVYYRGREIGRVTSVYFSPDSAYVLAKFKVNEKGVKIYKGSEVDKTSRSLTPRNLLKIIPPENIAGKSLLKKGSILDEKPKEKQDTVEKVLSSLYKDQKFSNIITNLEEATANFNKFSKTLSEVNKGSAKDINKIIKDSSKLIKGLNDTSDSLNSLIGDEQTIDDIKTTISATKNTVQSVDKLVNKADNAVDKLGDSEIGENLDSSAKNLSDILTDIKEITGDEDTKKNLKSLLNDSNEIMTRLKCFSKEAGSTLSKRFLLPRMMFGAPGKNIKYCFEDNKLSENESKK